jgi:hypothetical protein
MARHATFGLRSESVLDIYNLLLAMMLSSAAIIILSLAAMIAYSTWEEWINLALGLWLVVSPYLLGFAHTPAMHFSIGIGSAIVFFAGLELWLRYEAAHSDETQGGEIPGDKAAH